MQNPFKTNCFGEILLKGSFKQYLAVGQGLIVKRCKKHAGSYSQESDREPHTWLQPTRCEAILVCSTLPRFSKTSRSSCRGLISKLWRRFTAVVTHDQSV